MSQQQLHYHLDKIKHMINTVLPEISKDPQFKDNINMQNEINAAAANLSYLLYDLTDYTKQNNE